MMDNNKIEEAKDSIFNKHFLKNNEGMICVDHISEPVYLDYQIKQAIELGARWAINEFLKNLWHPASEAPKRRCNYLLLHYKDKEEECFEADVVDTKAWDCYIKGSLVEYINIDDLFPKKGGEQ